MPYIIKTTPHATMNNCLLSLVEIEGEKMVEVIINGVTIGSISGPKMGEAWKNMTGEEM
jgi:hypothetical protein